MTRFKHSGGKVMPDGTTVTVMARREEQLAPLIDKSAIMLGEARLAVRNTSLSLIGTQLPQLVVDSAQRYFSVNLREATSSLDFVTIKRVLKNLATGLSGDVTIKTGELIGVDDEDVYGRVNTQSVTDASLRGDPVAKNLVDNPHLLPQYQHEKVHHNFTTELGTGALLLTRAIKIDSARLQGPLHLAVKTFLHEASHKYAGTVDHGLFLEGNPLKPPLPKVQALANADSYAWFIVVAGYRQQLTR
jgi:hypothetical protein